MPKPNMYFGYSIAIDASGEVVIVGAPGNNTQADNKAFVFRFDGTDWNEEWFAVGANNDADWFGFSVAVSAAGDVFAAGAPARNVSNFDDNTGAVEVFRYQAGAWVQEALLRPLDASGDDYFGNYMAMSPDGRTIAARSFAVLTPQVTGAIYVFEHTGSGWVQTAKLIEPVSYAGGGWGNSLAFDGAGRTLAVGAPGDSRIFVLQGAVPIFRKGLGGWAYDSVVLPSFPVAGGGCGRSVALSAAGDRLLVGIPNQVVSGIAGGAVEEFELVNGTFQSLAIYSAPAREHAAHFGYSVASSASGRRWVAGEVHSDLHGTNVGNVHLFEAPCVVPTAYCTAQTASNGCVPRIGSLGTPSASRAAGFPITVADTRNQRSGHLFYGTSGTQALPWHGGTLCVRAPLRRMPLQHSGGNAAPADDCSGAFSFDFNTWSASGADPALFAGQRVLAQWVSRDPGAPSGFNVTDALDFRLEP